MSVDRTRTVASISEAEQVIDEYARSGYATVERAEQYRVLRKRDHGSLLMHIILFFIVGWWTLGLGNFAYAWYRHFASEDSVEVRLREGDHA